ncbi:MAG: FAD-dependent oxidoreductase [Alphaproteobacteria bacterium]|nr:FAD-dependent oxidoreductase [Alphaproteobacteria bacterium]
MKRIVVLGGGFAGLIAAAGAARKLAELAIDNRDIAVTLVNRDPWHAIRVRNYEADLRDVRVPLAEVLDPIGVALTVAQVTAIDCHRHEVALLTEEGPASLTYDRLVLALGSELVRPPIPGLAEHGFDIDTYAAAARLAAHLDGLPSRPAAPGRFTALVVGGGLTGVEMATDLATRLRRIAGTAPAPVILADRAPRIGSNMGDAACAVIDEALAALGVETRPGITVAAVSRHGARLTSGEEIAAGTVIWCGGMRAHPLAAAVPGEHDRFGRAIVDRFLRVVGTAGVFAAGDAAAALVDGEHASVMSCQHARPMGRIAGHNVVCDLVGETPIPLEIGYYVTCLDLGAWGAVYCQGWDRHVAVAGGEAKKIKRTINCERIYPPRTGVAADILAAAAPVTQAPPRQP